MSEITERAGLSIRYKNHSTTVHLLRRPQIQDKDIPRSHR